MKVDALPRDAAQFRSWKNAFVTKVCAIDRTGADTLLKWLLPAFETSHDTDLSDPQGLPRFDAHLASLLADPKHLNSELGIQLSTPPPGEEYCCKWLPTDSSSTNDEERT